MELFDVRLAYSSLAPKKKRLGIEYRITGEIYQKINDIIIWSYDHMELFDASLAFPPRTSMRDTSKTPSAPAGVWQREAGGEAEPGLVSKPAVFRLRQVGMRNPGSLIGPDKG